MNQTENQKKNCQLSRKQWRKKDKTSEKDLNNDKQLTCYRVQGNDYKILNEIGRGMDEHSDNFNKELDNINNHK